MSMGQFEERRMRGRTVTMIVRKRASDRVEKV